VSPKSINWQKDLDEVWLYGPFLPAKKLTDEQCAINHAPLYKNSCTNKSVLKPANDRNLWLSWQKEIALRIKDSPELNLQKDLPLSISSHSRNTGLGDSQSLKSGQDHITFSSSVCQRLILPHSEVEQIFTRLESPFRRNIVAPEGLPTVMQSDLITIMESDTSFKSSDTLHYKCSSLTTIPAPPTHLNDVTFQLSYAGPVRSSQVRADSSNRRRPVQIQTDRGFIQDVKSTFKGYGLLFAGLYSILLGVT
jgi:hypothetical protein